MKRSWICLLMLVAVLSGAALVGCGGGSSSKATATAAPTKSEGGSTPSGQATTAEQATSAPTSSSGGGSSASLSDIPVYPGATKVTSGEFSGSNAGIPSLGSDINSSDYNHVAYAMYQTSDGAQTVFDWYKDKMSGWKDEGSYSGGSEGSVAAFAAWSKDDGKTAAWISVGESEGQTSLSIWVGTP